MPKGAPRIGRSGETLAIRPFRIQCVHGFMRICRALANVHDRLHDARASNATRLLRRVFPCTRAKSEQETARRSHFSTPLALQAGRRCSPTEGNDEQASQRRRSTCCGTSRRRAGQVALSLECLSSPNVHHRLDCHRRLQCRVLDVQRGFRLAYDQPQS